MYRYYFKLSVKSLLQTPLLSGLMVLAIALGISVSMTVITVHYLMSKDPIPEKSRQLFHVQLDTSDQEKFTDTVDGLPYQLTYQDATNLIESDIPKRQTRSLATGYSVMPEDESVAPFLENARAIDNDFFSMFNVPFIVGAPWDDSVDKNASHKVVISKDISVQLFGTIDAIGKLVNLDGTDYEVTGVIDEWNPTPRMYDLNNGSFLESEKIFVPFSLVPIDELPSWGNNSGWKNENINTYQDKLKSEIVWIQYWVELNTESQQLAYRDYLAAYAADQKSFGRFPKDNPQVNITNARDWLDYNEVVSDDNSVLLGLSFMFLAVCMINTVALLLAKFSRKETEVGVRRALGASRGEVFKQHLMDVALIGLAGGVLGLMLGQIGLIGVKNLYEYERLINMDLNLIVFAILLSITSSVVAGLYPAWNICRTNPSVYLKAQ